MEKEHSGFIINFIIRAVIGIGLLYQRISFLQTDRDCGGY